MHLGTAEADAVARQIAGIEARTGVQIVTAVVGRAARYPEARWKAFALGLSVAALLVVASAFLRPDWSGGAGATLASIVTVLAVGITCALGATFSERFGHLFVRRNRAEVEVRQYAEGLFLARGLFATPHRTAVLLVVSLLERVVVLHADRGFDGRVEAFEWESVVAPMTAMLRLGKRAAALEAGLAALEQLLVRKGFVAAGGGRNVLPDRPIEERGV